MKAVPAETMYQQFLEMLQREYAPEKIHNGVFGAMMDVALVNDGPVTLVIDSRKDVVKTDGREESNMEGEDCLWIDMSVWQWQECYRNLQVPVLFYSFCRASRTLTNINRFFLMSLLDCLFTLLL